MEFTPIFPFRDDSSILKINSRAPNDIFVQNDNLEDDDSEDDISSGYDTTSSDDSAESRYENYTLSHMLFTPSLEDLRNILYVALNPYFEEFEIAVVSCPCLTSEPYNLAATGLSGNTGILQLGTFDNFCPSPQTDFAFDIQNELSRCNDDVFVIGSGFAAQPLMPCNGHLTINAVVSANPTNVINNSCIAYVDASTSQKTLEIINDHDQIKCSIFGQFFFSEGKRGPVIKMRAKGRRSRSSIIALIQAVLANRCQYKLLIGLGIVLVLNGGQTEQYLLLHDFVNYSYNEIQDYCNTLSLYSLNCINLIALGAVLSDPLMVYENIYDKMYFRDETSMFNVLLNFESLGNFFKDLTPEKTEYIVYINIAQENCSVM